MRFIKQKDMSAQYLDPEGNECWNPPIWCEEPLVDEWLKACAERSDIEMEVTDAPDGAFLDPGGMVMRGEPMAHVEVNGQRLTTYLRSAESLASRLRRPNKWREPDDGPAHVLVRSPTRGHVLLTLETALLAADAFEAENNARAHEVDAWWEKRDAALARAGAVDGMAAKNPVEAVKHEARRAAAEGGSTE